MNANAASRLAYQIDNAEFCPVSSGSYSLETISLRFVSIVVMVENQLCALNETFEANDSQSLRDFRPGFTRNSPVLCNKGLGFRRAKQFSTNTHWPEVKKDNSPPPRALEVFGIGNKLYTH